MYCIFLSDAHLRGRGDPNQKRLVSFLEDLTMKKDSVVPDALFLLGDIFDYWVSPGGFIDPVYLSLLNAIKRLTDRNVRIHYHIGNHDFFVKHTRGDIFDDIDIIEDGTGMDLDGIKCFITHGDTIDYTDKKYRFLRRVLRSGFIHSLSELLPAGVLRRIGSSLSKRSREVWTVKRAMPTSVIEEYIGEKAMQGFDVLIAAHFHTPEIRELAFDGKKITYINTGNWFSDYSYIVFKNGRFELKYYTGAV
ncbi:MAG: UDP-2,3-diacylglucosamine diphosphatase [Deltaproteobacteria bacterium]|nr:UDP-2,3-diacylglucosamine diphosphatase [Deltaproteobacteria bacterium]MCL5278107.1 UDP-2,3-diacylglucosamine diphosphatase [Deltaproteobacteria bacterium]